MYDAGKIIAGLVVFLVLVTSPLWYNAVFATTVAPPKLVLPTNGSTRCVEDTATMRASHMDLLNQWRDEVVRHDERVFVSPLDGVRYDKSLTRTCLGCHTNKKTFCDACHTYMAVSPYCWDCHVAPKEES
jgi:hypothetical protein